ERRCPRLRELVPALAAQPRDRQAQLAQQLERVGMHLALRMAAGAERPIASLAPLIEQDLGHDAAGRVAAAKEEDVAELIGHCTTHHGGGWSQHSAIPPGRSYSCVTRPAISRDRDHFGRSPLMIPTRDRWQAANLMVKRYGADAGL